MYRFIDHTADIAFEVNAENLEKLFEESAKAFYEAFCDVNKIKNNIEKEIILTSDSVDTLLYNWLNELLFLFDVEYFAGKEIRVKIRENEEFKLKSVLKGGNLSYENVKLEPKAITLHKFRVERINDSWYAFVIIDI